MEIPLVSVCVPAYNNENFIKNTIQCIIDQTYKNWELVIADDVSKDSTLEIIRSYKDPRIRVIANEKNLGLVGNCNNVMSAAKGEYIKLLCGDDLISPDCLEKQVQIFTSGKYPSVSLVSSYTDLIDSNGKLLTVRKYPFRKGFIKAGPAGSYNLLFGTNTIGEPGCVLFKRSLFSEIGYFDAANPYCVDLDFWFRIFLIGDLYIIPESLASFRISKGAVSSKIKKQQADLYKQFAYKVYNDKRFGINIFQYWIAGFSSYLLQHFRKIFTLFYLKD